MERKAAIACEQKKAIDWRSRERSQGVGKRVSGKDEDAIVLDKGDRGLENYKGRLSLQFKGVEASDLSTFLLTQRSPLKITS